MKDIWYWQYSLKPRAPLNALSEGEERPGALIRIGYGYGNIHPWPELGDEPLGEQLRILKEGGETPLIAGAKNCIAFDGEMRQRGAGCAKVRIPESHWLVRPGDDPGFAKEEGFTIAKFKCGLSFNETRKAIGPWIEAGFRLRLDFNECFAEASFLPFWESLSEKERAAVEFVEDPERYSYNGWACLRTNGVPIAVDRDAAQRLGLDDVLVMKPARPDWCMNPETRFAITSYMDHAVGQMFAALSAAGFSGNSRLLTCGLLTHRCYEDDAFFERIRTDGPRLLPVEGTGLGFDDLLEKLPWKRLT